MNKNLVEIDKKILTKEFINFLETSVADEVILSSFIRKTKILFHSNSVLHVGADCSYAVGFLKERFSNHYSLAALEILNKKLEVLFFETENYELKTSYKNNSPSNNDETVVDRSLFHINKSYNFQNFVVASFNKNAVEACTSIIKERGAYNPLFIFSKSGFGKSHLLHSIGNKVLDNKKTVMYVNPDDFTNEVKKAIDKGGDAVEKLKQEYCSFDFLLIDDVQFFSNRVKTMEIFFDIFNKVLTSKKQIVFASDKAFNELGGFEDRYISRFGSGLVVNMGSPSVDDFAKIIKNKIKFSDSLSKYRWDSSAIGFLARNISDSVRALESRLTRIKFLIGSYPPEIVITEELLKDFFKDFFIDEISITPEKIIEEVGKYYRVSKANIFSKSRKKEFVLPRHVSMFFCKKIKRLSFSKIGELFNGRDHSTVISAISKIETILKTNKSAGTAISTIENRIRRMT